MLWLAATALAGGGWTVETGRPAARCPVASEGVMGVAAVVYSRKQGTMAWGHASLRVVSCRDGRVVDREYESYRMSRWNERQLRLEHEGEPFLEGDWLKTQRGALVLFRNPDPVAGGWFADAQRHNREIYEVWLDLPQEELDRIGLQVEAWYDEQLATLRAREDLPLRYRALSTNCTWVLQALLPDSLTAGRDPHLPFAWLRALEDEAERRVLYPSAHLVGRWEDGQVVDRPRPVFRSARSGPAAPR